MMALLLAAQLTVIVQMEQHQTIEAQGDSIVTNEWRDWVFSAPQEIGQLQDALRSLPADASSQAVSNQIVSRVDRLLNLVGKSNESVSVVMP